MKFLQTFVIVFIATFGVAMAQSPKGKGMAEVSINTSAQCEMCQESIEKALKAQKGVKLASLDLNTKAVKVIYNANRTNPDALRKIIAGIGYDADEVPADKKAYAALPGCCKK